MYTIAFKDDSSAPTEVHATNSRAVLDIICILEKSTAVTQFKVMEPGYTITDLYFHFGWGTFSKFVTVLTYK